MSADKKGEQKIYFALQHPLRRQILFAVKQADKPIAPSEFVEQISPENSSDSNGLAYAAYHFRVLADVGLIEIKKEQPVRGAVKKFFAVTAEFTAEILDRLALDRIADLIVDDARSEGAQIDILPAIRRIVAITGRPLPEEKAGSARGLPPARGCGG